MPAAAALVWQSVPLAALAAAQDWQPLAHWVPGVVSTVPAESGELPALVQRQVVVQTEELPPFPPLVPFGTAAVGHALPAPGVPSSQSS